MAELHIDATTELELEGRKHLEESRPPVVGDIHGLTEDRADTDPVSAARLSLKEEIELREALVESGRRFLLAYRHQFRHPDPALAAGQAMRLMILLTEDRQTAFPASTQVRLDDPAFVQETARMVLGYLGVEQPD